MPNPDLIPVPFAQDGQKNSIQLDRLVSDPAYRATWLEGFPPDTRIPKEVGGEGPDGLDFNGILNALSQAVVFLQKGNAYQFDASLAPYPIGALVRSNDNLTTYQSTIAGNSNDPNSNMTGWRVYNSSNFLVNDLTTGGTDKAPTAEVIKQFYQMFAGSKSTYGYQSIAGGLIIQWCEISLPAFTGIEGNSSASFTFPTAFPNGVLMSGSFIKTAGKNSNWGDVSTWVTNESQTSATVVMASKTLVDISGLPRAKVFLIGH